MMSVSALGWLVLVLALCVSTFGASCVVAIVLGFLAFIIGSLTLLYIQSGNFEDVYFSCNLLNNPLAVQEIPAGGLAKIVECVKKPKTTQKTDQRVTGSDLIDSSLQEIFGYIIRDYVQPWYSLISSDSDFIDYGVRKSAQTLAIHISNRVKEIDWLPYLTTRLVDDAATQLRLFRGARSRQSANLTHDAPSPSPARQSPKHRRNKSDTDITSAAARHTLTTSGGAADNIEQHFFTLEAEGGAEGRGAVCMEPGREHDFLVALTELLLYVVLPDEDFRCSSLRVLLREMSVSCLLRPMIDLAVDADTINQALLWLCVRDGTLSSDAFLTALRLTEDLTDLRSTRDLVTRELQQLRGRDSTSADSFVKQQIGSLHYLSRLIDTRLAKLQQHSDQHQPSLHSTQPPDIHLPLDALLKNNVALSYFIDYVTGVGQQAYLFFYLNVEGWRVTAEQQLASMALGEEVPVERLRETARHIYQQYLAENSVYKLSVPQGLLNTLQRRIWNLGEPPSELWFDEVQRHVHDVMARDDVFVAGFERSAGYAKLLAELDLVPASVADEDDVVLEDTALLLPPAPARKHARSYSDITCSTSTTNTPAPIFQPTDDSEEDYSNLKVGNFTLSVDIIEAGVMTDKGKTFGIYATQVSKLWESGFLEQWHIYRRYSDFHDLQARVRDRWADLARLPFPGKKPFHNMERGLLERRMRALNTYMATLCRPVTVETHPGLRALLQHFTEQAEYDRAQSGNNAVRAIRHKMDEMVGKVFNKNVTVVAAPTVSPLDTYEGTDNIPLRVLLILADEVFDLRSRNQWLRRRLVTLLRQIVRAWFGDIVTRRIMDWVAEGTSPRSVARGLRLLQHAVWPGGMRAPSGPRRSTATRARTRLAAKVALLAAPALTDELKRLLGSETTRSGLLTCFHLVQRPVLTKRLLYVVLEGMLAHLLPEKEISKLFRQLYVNTATSGQSQGQTS